MEMKPKKGVIALLTLPLVATLAAVCQPPASNSAVALAAAAAAPEAAVKRGEYLVTIMGCHDCHTPKQMGERGPVLDRSRSLAGHPDGGKLPPPPAAVGPWIASAAWDLTAWSGPWGISYAANLTPHETTGLGIWTEEMFVSAIRTGRHMGQSRPILPPMPWEMYAQATDEDLAAIFAYLKSLPPIENPVPEPVPPGGHPPEELPRSEG
jgi:hypothetical protein